ncbi:MAG: tRNA dihydrouridine synthase DusB [Burkholderiales bacterium]
MIFGFARSNVFLAPMAGITDSSFRQIAIEMGAGFTYTEMASAAGLKYGSKRTKELISPAPNEEKMGVQLFGKDAQTITESIAILTEALPDIIALFDINMGCPAPKITGNGEGCALMNDLPRAASIIEAAVKASTVPVTVKFRKGWDENNLNAVEFAKMAEGSGASAVAVHGRTRSQFYSGKADLGVIADVKNAVSVPVIGNGDIFTAQDAKNMFEKTGCDAVMVARGALGNPFLFREINALLTEGKTIAQATPRERAAALLYHARLAVSAKGERLAMLQIRKHAAWYLKGVKNASKVREAAVRLSTLDELEGLILEIFSENAGI